MQELTRGAVSALHNNNRDELKEDPILQVLNIKTLQSNGVNRHRYVPCPLFENLGVLDLGLTCRLFYSLPESSFPMVPTLCKVCDGKSQCSFIDCVY